MLASLFFSGCAVHYHAKRVLNLVIITPLYSENIFMEYIPVTLVSVRMRHFRRCGVIAATLSDATVVTAPILMDTSFPRPTKIPKILGVP